MSERKRDPKEGSTAWDEITFAEVELTAPPHPPELSTRVAGLRVRDAEGFAAALGAGTISLAALAAQLPPGPVEGVVELAKEQYGYEPPLAIRGQGDFAEEIR